MVPQRVREKLPGLGSCADGNSTDGRLCQNDACPLENDGESLVGERLNGMIGLSLNVCKFCNTCIQSGASYLSQGFENNVLGSFSS